MEIGLIFGVFTKTTPKFGLEMGFWFASASPNRIECKDETRGVGKAMSCALCHTSLRFALDAV